MSQHMKALENANKNRVLLKEMKERVRDGRVPLRDVLMAPPKQFEHYAIVDVVRLARNVPRYRSPAWFQRMGQAASQQQINLLIPVGTASLRTRRWVVQYAEWHLPRRKGVAPMVRDAA